MDEVPAHVDEAPTFEERDADEVPTHHEERDADEVPTHHEEEEEEYILTRRNVKTIAGLGKTTMVETPGITPRSSGRKENPTFSAVAAPITPPCNGEAGNDGILMTKQDEDEERNNQGDNNTHTMSHDDYLKVIKKMENMAERLKLATIESKQLASAQEALAVKDAIMAAQAAGWEEQRKDDLCAQLQRDNDTLKMIL